MPEPLKETLFNRTIVERLADAVLGTWPAFDRPAFLERVFDSAWAGLELKERMRRITLVLHDLLPQDYRSALAILQQAALQMEGAGFATMVFDDYVELYGLDDWDVSLPALAQFTCLCSAEYAVRPFILRDPQRMMAQMLAWSGSDNKHHRRLSSEGCRPRLPWAISLPVFKKDPAPILSILEQLKNDPEDYVRRSVANNLNDITKDNPQVVIDLLAHWKAEGLPAFEEIASRALRSMIKDGDPAALGLMGFAHGGDFEVQNLAVSPQRVPAGGKVSFSFNLVSSGTQEQAVVIDYVMHHQRARGQQTPKVFKLCKKSLAGGQSLTISGQHSFKPISTRRYYPGTHSLEIQVNGTSCGRVDFELEE